MNQLHKKIAAKNLDSSSRIVEVLSWELPSLSYEADCGVLEKMLEKHEVVAIYKQDEEGNPTEVY